MYLLKRFLKQNILLLSTITIVGLIGMYLMDTFFQYIAINIRYVPTDHTGEKILIDLLITFALYWCSRGLICIMQQFFVGTLVSRLRVFATKHVFENLTNLTQEYYIRNGSQTLAAYVEKYQSSICILLQSYMIYIVPPVLFMLYMFYVFFTKSIIMGTIVSIWLACSVGLYIYIHKQKHYHNDKFINNSLQMASFINDSLNNYELNTVYQLHNLNKTTVSNALEGNCTIERRVFNWQGFNELLFTLLSIGMFVFVAYFSFTMFGEKQFMFFFGLSKFMFWIVWYRMEWINMNQIHVDNVQSIDKMISDLPKRIDLEQNNASIDGDIVMENVTFKTNEGKIILNIPHLVIKKGDKVAIHGKSGSGKSTLLFLLSKQILPHSGVITINGNNIAHIDTKNFFEQAGYISQNNCFFNDTVEYNLRLAKPDATMEELNYIMAQVEMSYINLQTSINNLSAGEKQRVNIARALFKKSSILFCDEITSSLDNKTTVKIQQLILRLFSHATILWVDHSQCIAEYSNKVITVDGGEIIDVTTVNNTPNPNVDNIININY